MVAEFGSQKFAATMIHAAPRLFELVALRMLAALLSMALLIAMPSARLVSAADSW